MTANGIAFRHPIAFWLGSAMLVAGVLAHGPMFAMSAHTHYRMVGMAMDATMVIGMALIPLGLILAAYGLLPRIGQLRASSLSTHDPAYFHLADSVALNREHWTLVVVLIVALSIDVMKPATLGFVMPGMIAEYAISNQTGALLALVALAGTTVGSVAWGHLGDALGRRAAILLSALMFIGTAICGAMPTFEWNLAMCFLMGASAGGLLPIAFTLMAETVPAAHRGWLLVTLGGVGTSAGYLLAAGAAALLEQRYSWRVLWLLGLPTGALIIVLNRWIPESPRFLSSVGLERQARAVLMRFSDVRDVVDESARIEKDDGPDSAEPVLDEKHPIKGMRQLVSGRYAPVTWGLTACGVSWGLANFGFVLWLPTNLVALGIPASGSSELLAKSALLALPGIPVVVWLYHRWSTIKSLILFISLSILSLIAFMLIAMLGLQSATATMFAAAALLISISGVIAMLIPYASEIYPVHVRGVGSGVVAASSKFGGILGAGLGVIGFFDEFILSTAAIAVPLVISGLLLYRSGIETRGLRLEDIQTAMEKALPDPAASTEPA
ncbi:MAG: MFS transporter [Dokdonella sp.]